MVVRTLPKLAAPSTVVLDALDLEPQLLDAGPDQEQPAAEEDQRLDAEGALEVDSEHRRVEVVERCAGETKHPADQRRAG